LRRRLHPLRRVLPAGVRRRLSDWLRRRGFKPDAHYRIRIEYPTSASNAPRWKPHPELERIIAAHDARHRESLELFGSYTDAFRAEAWTSGWLPVLDAVAIYAFIRSRSPALYVEVGSGVSTRFAARAKRDGELGTQIVSIDPRPRTDVDDLCDRILRMPLESVDTSLFGELSEGDVVFLDGTHRTFMNSDATVFFLEVLPRLASGVLVGVHDVFLPYDYPEEFADRYYSEQYLLAAHLLAGNPRLEPILPTFYARHHPELSVLAASVESSLGARGGCAFWLETRTPR